MPASLASSAQETDGAELLPALQAAQLALAAHAQAMEVLGDINLPDEAPSPAEALQLKTVAPLYLAAQLDEAGVLHTAETVAGLYVGGSVTAPLGAAGQQMLEFWRERKHRLTEGERQELYGHVFEAPHFPRLLAQLAQDVVAHADNLEVYDLREAIALEQHAHELLDYLSPRAGGMTSFAAQETVAAINAALAFLRDSKLQAAFSVHGLNALLQMAATPVADASGHIRRCFDRARHGHALLAWLVQAAAAGLRLDPHSAGFSALIAAAQGWLLAQEPVAAPVAGAPVAAPAAVVAPTVATA